MKTSHHDLINLASDYARRAVAMEKETPGVDTSALWAEYKRLTNEANEILVRVQPPCRGGW